LSFFAVWSLFFAGFFCRFKTGKHSKWQTTKAVRQNKNAASNSYSIIPKKTINIA
jgi:hypothetical protein